MIERIAATEVFDRDPWSRTKERPAHSGARIRRCDLGVALGADSPIDVSVRRRERLSAQ